MAPVTVAKGTLLIVFMVGVIVGSVTTYCFAPYMILSCATVVQEFVALASRDPYRKLGVGLETAAGERLRTCYGRDDVRPTPTSYKNDTSKTANQAYEQGDFQVAADVAVNAIIREAASDRPNLSEIASNERILGRVYAQNGREAEAVTCLILATHHEQLVALRAAGPNALDMYGVPYPMQGE